MAEDFARPLEGQLGSTFGRRNEFGDLFYLRWGRITFDVRWGAGLNIKVLLRVYRADGVCETFIVDTDPYDAEWDRHKRATRDFFIHPFPGNLGRVTAVKFAFIVHLGERSVPSRLEYIFMDREHFDRDGSWRRDITPVYATENTWRTHECDAAMLQRDVDWINAHPESVNPVPKFTRGQPQHPYHPKRYVHDMIDATIAHKRSSPDRLVTIKVSVDCVDDTDFVNHLLYAAGNGVWVQVQVDWRKMVLTNSENYVRLKRSGIELLGVFCTVKHDRIEMPPDMHNKFVVFGQADAIVGSFNMTFDRWGSNWESGMALHSEGVARLLDNVFHSIRGGVVQRYVVDPFADFNLLYTFGRQVVPCGEAYRPQQAIFTEIHRARRCIKLNLFMIGELAGDHEDSVVDALLEARRRGVDVQAIVNGHMARKGDPATAHPMGEELSRPLQDSVIRLKHAGIPVFMAYGVHDNRVPYCPIHAKSAVFDDSRVLDGSFNWYNTSAFSHDVALVVSRQDVAWNYLNEWHATKRNLRMFT